MKNILQNILYRNSKKVPVFFNTYQLEESNYALLGKLSSSILHDVLTPLTSLLLTQEKTSTSLKPIVETSSKQLLEYIGILKDFMYPRESSCIHINKEISKSILLLKHKALCNNVQIQFLELNQIYANVHPLHIYQIVINLLSNAIEASTYTKTKKVILTLKQIRNTHIQIECRDFGSGIPREILKHIGDKIISTKSKGRGFGLYSVDYIVKNILHGSILIESSKKHGTLFVCRFPII